VGADVVQALDWAQKAVGESRTFAIGLKVTVVNGSHLVYLLGQDMNDSTGKFHDVFNRMYLRAADPLSIPAHDQWLDSRVSPPDETRHSSQS